MVWGFGGVENQLGKSEMIPEGSVDNVDALAIELGCKVEASHPLMLGMPLSAHYKSVAAWDL